MAARKNHYRVDRALGLQLWQSDVRSEEIARRLHTTRIALYVLAHKLGWPKRTPGRRPDTPKPVARRTDEPSRVDRQLLRCEQMLAAEHRTPLARFRRCEVCNGIEDTRTPHQHGAAA